jgi:hypothetical protein
MTARSLAQQANALVTKYVNLYKEVHGSPPVVNRHRDRWGFQSMIEDLGKGDAERVIAYYFSIRKPHEISDLLRHYDDYHKNRLHDEEDKRRVAKLHEETARRVREWREKNGQ